MLYFYLDFFFRKAHTKNNRTIPPAEHPIKINHTVRLVSSPVFAGPSGGLEGEAEEFPNGLSEGLETEESPDGLEKDPSPDGCEFGESGIQKRESSATG